jgi:hypothetical protein
MHPMDPVDEAFSRLGQGFVLIGGRPDQARRRH